MPESSTNDGSGKQPQIRFNITRVTGSIPNSKPSGATCQSQPTDNTSPQSIRFNITRVTGSIPKTSTLQDQTNSVESAGSDSPNAAPSTTTNQSPQQQATIGTAELQSPRTKPPPPLKTENQSSCEQKTSTTTIDEPGQLTIEMINHTKECLTKIKQLVLWMKRLSEEFNKKL